MEYYKLGIIAACLLVRVCEVCVVVWFQLEAVVCRLEEQGEDGVDSGSLLELKNTLQELITVSEGVHMYMCVCVVCVHVVHVKEDGVRHGPCYKDKSLCWV